MLIDDFKSADLVSTLGTRWRGVTDTVMGGVSQVIAAARRTRRSAVFANGRRR